MSNYPPSQPPGQPPGNYPPPPPGYPGGPPQGWQGPPPGWQGAPPPGYYGQPPRKSNKGLIIGLVIGVVLLISIGVAFWFLVIRTHSGPVTVAANLMTSLNPDLEIVSVDEEKELITFKEKKSGKVFTITLKEAQGGKITIKGDGGEEVSVEGKDDGSGGSVNIKSKEGTVTFGSGSAASLPDWLPAYPGADMQGIYSTNTSEGKSAGLQFTTSDSPEEVMDFYESALKEKGMRVTTSKTQSGGTEYSQVTGVDSSGNRTAFINAGTEGGATKVTMGYTSKY